VKQSGGCIQVQSEVGRGTVFRIYLPQVDGTPDLVKRRATTRDVDGTETVLLVEDDDAVRSAVQRMIEPRGYRLLIARTGSDAIDLARTYGGRIDLVLSDVVMPGACGPEVVGAIRERCPAVRSLFMSGHTDHALLQNDALGPGMNFIQKPFAPEALAKKIRDVLDA
jgi:DNA-binding NtrC family response regulator